METLRAKQAKQAKQAKCPYLEAGSSGEFYGRVGFSSFQAAASFQGFVVVACAGRNGAYRLPPQ